MTSGVNTAELDRFEGPEVRIRLPPAGSPLRTCWTSAERQHQSRIEAPFLDIRAPRFKPVDFIGDTSGRREEKSVSIEITRSGGRLVRMSNVTLCMSMGQEIAPTRPRVDSVTRVDIAPDTRNISSEMMPGVVTKLARYSHSDSPRTQTVRRRPKITRKPVAEMIAQLAR